MKNQALFSSKDKSKKLKCRLLHFLFGVLRINQTAYVLDLNSSKKMSLCDLHLMQSYESFFMLTPSVYM